MALKKYNIVIPKKYTQNGEEKTQWNNVGTLVRFAPTDEKPEGYIMELSMFPNVTFKVFEQKAKEDKVEKKAVANTEMDTYEVDASAIPY